MNKKFNEYKSINYYEVGSDILSFWKKRKIFEKSITLRNNGDVFSFYEGPPSANGMPGIHHVMSRTIKDIFCRYKTLKGFKVYRKGGWDAHGLPVEIQVEKKLGITKDDIGKSISVDEYNKKCRSTVMQYKKNWEDLTEKIGYWLDLNNSYVTFKNEYIESVWWSIKELYKKGLLYKSYTIQPFSPAAGTGLSSHELNMPGSYKEIFDVSITAQFKLINNEKSQNIFQQFYDNIYFLAWTTTPWTLPANNGLAVGKKIVYSLVETYNKYTKNKIKVILAQDCLSYFFDSKNEIHNNIDDEDEKNLKYKILITFKGSDFIGLDYEQLLPYVKAEKPAFTVVDADFVSTNEGTGIVHISKTFGSDDYKISIKNQLPGIFVKNNKGEDVPIVDKLGKFVKEIKDFAGMYVKDFNKNSVKDELSTDAKISIKLKIENKAFDVKKHKHSYPHCWRTDKPILYYPMDSWFIKTTKLKKQFIKQNKEINWHPKSTGSGRFGDWLENLVDWNLSRSRFWGTPLPIWRTKNGSEEICIGSFQELKKEVKKSYKKGFMESLLDDTFDMHRPYVDDIVLVSNSGNPMYRELDIIDVWYDSGSVPFAQYHYPFENSNFFKEMFPAKFIAEGIDQTRGWFFTLHVISIMLFGKKSFENVISNGLVLDRDGNKMSKRLGNAVDPFEIIKNYGPDATRWYMISNSNPWDNLKFDEEGIKEVLRKFFGTLSNTYNFFALYANIDGFTNDEKIIDYSKRSFDDRWIISKLNSTIKSIDNYLENFDPTKAARCLNAFLINDLSNWYVRLNRKRFWKGDYSDDKKMAYQTLFECLEKIAILSSPFIPFYSEYLFRDLHALSKNNELESVHFSDFPKVHNNLINKNLEIKMKYAQNISSLVHSIRKKEKIKVRQPLGKLLIPIKSDFEKKNIISVSRIILNEVNIKKLEFIDDSSKILVKKASPNYKVVGKMYGSLTNKVVDLIKGFNNEDIINLEKRGFIKVKIDNKNYSIDLDQVVVKYGDISGWSIANNDLFTIALDINISEELKLEGISREFINRIQNLRKELGLSVIDKISIDIIDNQSIIIKAIKSFNNYVCNEIQATTIKIKDNFITKHIFEFENNSIHFLLKKNK
jgi:isoleucyl-tRNA synthetase